MCAVMGQVVSIRPVSAASISLQRVVEQDHVRHLAGGLDDRFESRAGNRHTDSGGAELRFPEFARHGVAVRNQHERRPPVQVKRRGRCWLQIVRHLRHGPRFFAERRCCRSKNAALIRPRDPRSGILIRRSAAVAGLDPHAR